MALLAGLLLWAAAGGAQAGAGGPAVCDRLFRNFDTTARVHPTQGLGDRNVPPAALSRVTQDLRGNGCLTSSADLDGMSALAARLAPFHIDDSGPAIRAVPVHLGVVTSISDEARATYFFRSLGYRSRGVGVGGLGRRLYIGPFTTQSAADQALAVAREAGFIAPFIAQYTKF